MTSDEPLRVPQPAVMLKELREFAEDLDVFARGIEPYLQRSPFGKRRPSPQAKETS